MASKKRRAASAIGRRAAGTAVGYVAGGRLGHPIAGAAGGYAAGAASSRHAHMHNHSAAADGPVKTSKANANVLKPGVQPVKGPPKAFVKFGIKSAKHGSGPESPLDGRG